MDKKKILVVLTNQNTYGDDPEKTGLWLAEATEFVEIVTKAGYNVDYVSPKGGEVPIDPRSMKKSYTTKTDLEILNSDDFRNRALEHSLNPSEINPKDYIAIYYTGGHGVVWDFPDNKKLQDIALRIYDDGGYVCSVCHGLAGLLNIRDKNGMFLITDKNITGFTKWEEVISGKYRKVPFITEKEAVKRGCDFKQKFPFTSFAIKDGHLITGQNPMSGKAVAKLLIKSLNN